MAVWIGAIAFGSTFTEPRRFTRCKVAILSSESLFESANDKIHGLNESLELNPQVLPAIKLDVFNKDLNLDIHVETYLIGEDAGICEELES